MFKYYAFDLKMKFGALILRHSHYMQVILIPLRPVLKLCLDRTKIDVLEGYFSLYWNLSSCSLLWKIPFSVQVTKFGWSELASLSSLCDLWKWFILKLSTVCVLRVAWVGVSIKFHLMHVQFNIQQSSSTYFWGSFCVFPC